MPCWPGNVRELRNAIHYTLVMCDGKQILPGDLPEELASATPALPARETLPSGRKTLSEVAIRQAVLACKGNLTQAARKLSVGRTTLWRYRKLWQTED